jgi:secreted PhoX family phosphatase
MDLLSRRDFMKRTAAVTGGLAIAGPLQALAGKGSTAQAATAIGYGPLQNKGDLWLPDGFKYKIISTEGDTMSDGNPTPSMFDGMAAFAGPRNTTILIRNHENRERPGEIPVLVPETLRWDKQKLTSGAYRHNGGCTKLVVNGQGKVLSTFAVLAGTSTNCAGGAMPWGSWITSEEIVSEGGVRHGYNFEIDADANGPVPAVPIVAAGRCVHEAVAWHKGILYETEDRGADAALYRFLPNGRPRKPGDLAAMGGELQALKVAGTDSFNTSNRPSSTMVLGRPYPVEWTGSLSPDPAGDTLRQEAKGQGSALFDRQEGIWVGNNRVYFACTSGGAAGAGQIFEYDPNRSVLTLLYESPGPDQLESPDNLVVTPFGDLLLCEDGNDPQYIRGLTKKGRIYDFARTQTRDSEFAGACFDQSGTTLFVNQQGLPAAGGTGEKGVTYAITGPWDREED